MDGWMCLKSILKTQIKDLNSIVELVLQYFSQYQIDIRFLGGHDENMREWLVSKLAHYLQHGSILFPVHIPVALQTFKSYDY